MVLKNYLAKSLVGALALATLSGCVSGPSYGTTTMQAAEIAKQTQSLNAAFVRYCEPIALGQTFRTVEQHMLRDGYTKIGEKSSIIPLEIPISNGKTISSKTAAGYKKVDASGNKSLVMLGYYTTNLNDKQLSNNMCLVSAGDKITDLTQESAGQYRAQLQRLLRQNSLRFQQKSQWPEVSTMADLQSFSKTGKTMSFEDTADYAIPQISGFGMIVKRVTVSDPS